MKNIILFTIFYILSTLFIPQNTCVASGLDTNSTVYYAMSKKPTHDNGIPKDSIEGNQNFDNEEQINNVQIQNETSRRLFTNFLFILIAIIVLLLFYLKKRRDVFLNKNKNNNSGYSDDLKSELISKLNNQNNRLREINIIINGLIRKVEDLENEINKLQESKTDDKGEFKEDQIHKFTQEKINNDSSIINKSNTQKEIKYLKGKTQNKFKIENDSKDDETYYSFEKSGNIGIFQFCGNAEKALGNFNAVFDNVCDYEGNTSNGKKITNIESGQVELMEGNWVVTKKAKIKVE